VAKAIPSLQGKFSGYALRVPTPTVSIVDFTAVLQKDSDTASLHAALKKAESGSMKGILGTCDLPLVSSDFKGDPRSSIVDLENTYVHDKRLAKVVSWYDNEWGYSNRVSDLIQLLAEKGL
jgi:glyceraldehyde 3-phosphate dehydrogenase